MIMTASNCVKVHGHETCSFPKDFPVVALSAWQGCFCCSTVRDNAVLLSGDDLSRIKFLKGKSHEINPELLSKGAERHLFKEIIHYFSQNATKFYYFLLIDVKPDLRKRRTARGFYLPVRTDGMCAPCHAVWSGLKSVLWTVYSRLAKHVLIRFAHMENTCEQSKITSLSAFCRKIYNKMVAKNCDI